MITDLHPDLLDVLAAVDRGDVHVVILGARRVRFVAGARNTPAIQCLLDAGLIEEDWECRPPLAPTGRGRAVLDAVPGTEN